MEQKISHQEIEAMRNLVRDHDKQNMGKVIDLSRPVIVPYPRHIPFPKAMYKHSECLPTRTEMREPMFQGAAPLKVTLPPYFEIRTVASQSEMDEAIEDGYSVDPPTFEDKKRPVGRPKAS